MSEETKSEYDDGQWYTVTLGHFISLLVDAGQDPAVSFRVTGDSAPDEDGKFCRNMEIVLLPNGYVKAAIGNGHVHKTLLKLIEAGLVK